MMKCNNKLLIPKRYKNCAWKDLSKDIQKIITKAVKEEKGLYLHGTCGTGKTYICYATMLRFKDRFPDKSVAMYYSVSEMLVEIRKNILSRSHDNYALTEDSLAESIANYGGVLILDDLGAEKATDFVLETMYNIINIRYENMLKTIITSNLSLSELTEKYGDRIPSRISEMCEVVKLTGKDKRLF